MGFLLDTNLVSEARKGAKADRYVAAWIAAEDSLDHFISVVTIMEIEIGIRLLERRDPAQASRLWRWLETSVLREFGPRILPVSLDIARRCAELHVPDRKPERDAIIAATATVHGLVVVTRNVKDFEPMNVETLNPWARI